MESNDFDVTQANIMVDNDVVVKDSRAPKRDRESFINRSSIGNLSKTPRLSDSPFRMVQMLDERFTKLSDKLVCQFKTMLKETETRIINEFEQKLSELRTNLDDVNTRVSNLEKVAGEIQHTKAEIDDLRIQLLRQENATVACEIRVNGIPFQTEENLFDVFANICESINIAVPRIKTIHRLQNRNNTKNLNSPDGVILIKFMSPYDKNFFLKSVSGYKKIHNNMLLLNSIGFRSTSQYYINENLSNMNYKFLQDAIHLKKKGLVKSAYTFRGLAYIKRFDSNEPICIFHPKIIDNLRALEEIPHAEIHS